MLRSARLRRDRVDPVGLGKTSLDFAQDTSRRRIASTTGDSITPVSDCPVALDNLP